MRVVRHVYTVTELERSCYKISNSSVCFILNKTIGFDSDWFRQISHNGYWLREVEYIYF